MAGETEGQSPADTTSNGAVDTRLPAGRSQRASIFQGFVDKADEAGTSSRKKREEPASAGDGEETEAKPKPRKAKAETNGHAKDDETEPKVEEDEGTDSSEDDAQQTDDDEAAGDEPGESAEGDGEGDEAEPEIRTFEDLAKATGLDPAILETLEFEVRHDGKPKKVTYRDLVKNWRSQADLTRGHQQVAEAKRQTAALHAEVADALKARIDESAGFLRAIKEHMTINEQIAHAVRDKPTSHAAVVARNKQAQELFEQGYKKVQELNEQRLEAESKAEEARVLHEYDTFVSRNPAYRDPQKLAKLGKEMAAFMGERGWDAEEVEAISDHRLIELVIEAMKPAKQAKAKAAVTAKTVRKLATKSLKGRPGPDKTSTSAERVRRAAEVVSKTGRGLAGWLQTTGRVS